MRRRIAWFDVETTSLAGDDDRVLLLEIAVVLTTLELEEVGREACVIAYTPAQLAAARWDPLARAMHDENGLYVECQSPAAVPLEETQRRIVQLVDELCPGAAGERDSTGAGSSGDTAPLWGGCSPWLDRTILRRVMPDLYGRVHYRSVDATSLKLALEWWREVDTRRARRPHRALEDALSAIALADRARLLLKQALPLTTAVA